MLTGQCVTRSGDCGEFVTLLSRRLATAVRLVVPARLGFPPALPRPDHVVWRPDVARVVTGRTRAGRSSAARFGPGGCATRTTAARRPRSHRAHASRRGTGG